MFCHVEPENILSAARCLGWDHSKKATAPAGKVLDGPSGPGPSPSAGPEVAVHGAEHTPYNFSVCAQPPQEAIFIPTSKSAPLKGQ